MSAHEQYEEAIKDLVKESFDGDSFTVEEALVMLRERCSRLDSLQAENEHLRRQVVDFAKEKACATHAEIALQEEIENLRKATEPGMLQLKQLLTEPAVNREFMRLASLAKSSSIEAAALREEMRSLHYISNDPKGSRALLAQVKSLENKCKSLSAEATESKASSLEASLKISEGKVSALKKKNHALEEKIETLLHDKDSLERELLALRHPREAKHGRGRG